MSLEDEIPDVVEKAMMGLGLGAEALAEKAGIGVSRIDAVLRGEHDESSLRAIAAALGLDAAALVRLPSYLPQEQGIPGVSRIELPFGQWTVNAWMLEHGGVRLLFDTGCSGEDITTAIGAMMPEAVFITHDHPDHVGGVPAMHSAGARVISETEALGVSKFAFGTISVRPINLSGHKDPTAGYFVDGFGKTLLVAGDAIFAGSIGRCHSNVAYRVALENLRRVFGESTPDCVILPGHGPASTIGEELSSNPFRFGFI